MSASVWLFHVESKPGGKLSTETPELKGKKLIQ